MKPVDAIIVVRTGSTRVPGKALFEVCGKPVLQHIIERVKACKNIRKICIATTTLPSDDPIIHLAKKTGIELFRGDPEMVLDRVFQATEFLQSESIIEIGGDCPFIDPAILDEAIAAFHNKPCDYLNNYYPPTFPEGMDINVLSVKALRIAFNEALAPSHRIHPFSYLPDNPQKFKVENYRYHQDLSNFHWSFDFPEDFEFIKAVYERLYPNNQLFGIREILELIAQDQLIFGLNERLKTPTVQNAFWNSPGIIRDLNNDILFLINRAKQALEEKEFAVAQRCYEQILKNASELNRFTQSKT